MSADMVRTGFLVIALLVAVPAAPAWAQQAASAPQITAPAGLRPMDARQRLRRSIYLMEGALARAVEFGVKDLNRRLRSAVPEMMALSGAPHARGVYLEGYGVYFDVSVPVLNQVMMWSWGRMLSPDESVVSALNQLKSYLQSEKDASRRAALQSMLNQIELQLGPIGSTVASSDTLAASGRPVAGAAGGTVVSPDLATQSAPAEAIAAADPPELKFDKSYFQDPNAINRAYTESVQNALILAILEHAHTMAIKPEEFLTIAARDNMQRDSLAPFDPLEEVVTILLRLKGADLLAYRAGQIDEAGLQQRIEIREF